MNSDAHISIEKQIGVALEEIRPTLNLHAGDLEFVRYEGGIVYIRFQGACVGCPLAQMTLKMGIERHLKTKIPEITEVCSVSD